MDDNFGARKFRQNAAEPHRGRIRSFTDKSGKFAFSSLYALHSLALAERQAL